MAKKMRENKAGNYIPNRFAEEISDALLASDMPDDFVRGGEVVLGYLSCREGEDMHGAGIAEWLDNASVIIEHDKAHAEIAEAATEVLGALKEKLADKGIEVADCYLVRMGGDAE